VSRIAINRDELRNKIYGCWLGKNIGGTLGGPYEGRREILDVKGYVTPKGEPMPNDDLDLQLVWLKAIEERGARGVNNRVLGEYWINYIPPPWNEYGIGKSNMKAGIVPPLSGEYHNPWKHSNGAWIRSEIWACLAPGCPDIAIRFAYEDASVDHGGGEGTYAALFTAAVQSAAFVVSDRDQLIKIGLSKIPSGCRVARAIKVVLDAHKAGKTWQQAREAVVADSEDLGWFQAPANVAFVIVGWMYGEGDFGKSIRIATNCGDDTDCTAATLGATLGIILGKDAIPKEWTEPIGDSIKTVAIDRGSGWFPGTLAELTDHVMRQVAHMLAAYGADVEITGGASDLSAVSAKALSDQTVAKQIWDRSPYAVTYDFIHTRVTVDYGREPDIVIGEPFTLKVVLENQMPDSRHIELRWLLPEGWNITSSASGHIALHHWPGRVEVAVEITPEIIIEGTNRAILEILAPGRPTVGLIPLVFLEGS